MNRWQATKQIKFLLEQQDWTDGSTSVFAKVIASVSPLESALKGSRFPFAMVMPGAAVVDPLHDEDPNYIVQDMIIRLAVRTGNDKFGQSSLIGGPRAAGATASRGRGVLEIEEEMFNALNPSNNENGIRLQFRAKSMIDPIELDGNVLVLSADYLFELTVSQARFYHDGTELVAVDDTSGNTTLTWVLTPNRFDRVNVILRRAAGSTPPATETDGTGITLSGPLATTVTDSPGAGTFSYSLFGGYNEKGGAVSDRFSVGIGVTIVVT